MSCQFIYQSELAIPPHFIPIRTTQTIFYLSTPRFSLLCDIMQWDLKAHNEKRLKREREQRWDNNRDGMSVINFL